MRDLLASLFAFLGGFLLGWILRVDRSALLAPPAPTSPPTEAPSLQDTQGPRYRSLQVARGQLPPQFPASPGWDLHLPRLTEQQIFGLLQTPENQGHIYVSGPHGGGKFIPVDAAWVGQHLMQAPSPHWTTYYIL